MTSPLQASLNRFQQQVKNWENRQRIHHLAQQVAEHSQPVPGQAPVVLFNASTRLTGLSLNAAFSLLVGWSLRLSGVPVLHFVCRSGMSHCVLGTNRDNYHLPPPCPPCIAQSERLYAGGDVHWFIEHRDTELELAIKDLDIDALGTFEYRSDAFAEPVPLGRLALPSIRWALRRHHLPDDEPTRYLLREYIISAWNVAQQFAGLLIEARPAAAVIFNGTMYPEATARWVCAQLGVPSIAHEVGFQRLSTFFTFGEPTAYPIRIPLEFELTPEMDARLDAYLEKRFQGQFTMAGIRFWPEMRGLDEAFLQKMAAFKQTVPVFTNVVYDTSQAHANVHFPHMFAWLDLVLEIIRSHPDTLFVIRAHPDEMRPGSKKLSNESVRDWVKNNGVDQLPNAIFIDSQEYVSSYELIQRAKFVIVYNSSIGMEASLMGAPVLCGGRARYTQYPIVFFPDSVEAYRAKAEEFLAAEEIGVPPEFQRNARRFLYYQLYRASLPLDHFLQIGSRQGFVRLQAFSWQDLLPENSQTMRTLQDGILGKTPSGEQPFLMTEEA